VEYKSLTHKSAQARFDTAYEEIRAFFQKAQRDSPSEERRRGFGEMLLEIASLRAGFDRLGELSDVIVGTNRTLIKVGNDLVAVVARSAKPRGRQMTLT